MLTPALAPTVKNTQGEAETDDNLITAAQAVSPMAREVALLSVAPSCAIYPRRHLDIPKDANQSESAPKLCHILLHPLTGSLYQQWTTPQVYLNHQLSKPPADVLYRLNHLLAPAELAPCSRPQGHQPARQIPLLERHCHQQQDGTAL